MMGTDMGGCGQGLCGGQDLPQYGCLFCCAPALCQQPGGRECRSCQSRGAPEAEQLVLDLGLLAVANCGNMMQYVAGACLRWYPSLAMFL